MKPDDLRPGLYILRDDEDRMFLAVVGRTSGAVDRAQGATWFVRADGTGERMIGAWHFVRDAMLVLAENGAPCPKAATVELATSLFENGRNRGRDGIIRDLTCALEHEHSTGFARGADSARAAALRESLMIARGMAQDSSNRIRVLEQELEALTARQQTKG